MVPPEHGASRRELMEDSEARRLAGEALNLARESGHSAREAHELAKEVKELARAALDAARVAASEVNAHQRECVLHYSEFSRTLARVEAAGNARRDMIEDTNKKVNSLNMGQEQRKARDSVLSRVAGVLLGVASAVITALIIAKIN